MSGVKNPWPNDNSYGHGIICHNCIAKKHLEGSEVQVVHIGTFVQVHSVREDNVLFYIVDEEMVVDSHQLVCKKADIIYVPESLWGPLFTVPQRERLALVEDRKLAEIMGNISVGHSVHVLGPDNTSICTGTVTFKNSISRLGVGVFFGLQILKTSKECFQSVIKKVSLLEPGTKGFPRGCDIVVTINKIRPCNINFKDKSYYYADKESQKQSTKSPTNVDDNNSSFKSMLVLNLKDRFSNNSKRFQHINNGNAEPQVNYTTTKKLIHSDNPLCVGDEIIYLHGGTPEKGVVRWIGHINNSLKVGVEFDNPIGSGTRKVDGIELFKAKYAHALVVSPMTLIKFSDYMTNNTNEVVQCKTNNNNNKNNNNYNNLKSNDFCCEGKQGSDEKYKMFKSNSHQCLKHSEKTFHCDDSFRFKSIEEDLSRNRRSCLNDSHNMDNSFEVIPQSESRSFDFGNSCERKMSYKRQCNSVDNALIQNKDPIRSHISAPNTNITAQRTPSQDLCDLVGPTWSKKEKNHNYYSEEKSNKELEDEVLASHKQISNNLYEEDFKNYHEKDVWDSQYSEFSSSNESITNFYDTPKASSSASCAPGELTKGSVVELTFKGEPHYGVIRWIGTLPDEKDNGPPRLIAGIEMEEERNGLTDGTFNNKRYFQCNSKKALFVPLNKCRKDSRFLDQTQRQSIPSKINYGQIDCPIVEGTIPPINTKGDIESICGKNRGIQGHHNSCYLDATLFSMFAFTSVFDSLLYRPPTKLDIPQYSEVQRVLREEIVNPLRKNLYVRADRVMKLRTLLDKLSSVSGLTSEEKDPEEFLNSLLAQILKAEPFLKLSSGQEAFHYQLFVEKDERLTFPSVQQLFEQSFVTSDIKLKQVPSCLIIQMPRFGKSFKMYSRILPPQLLDVTDIIENSPRQCTVCGKSAEYECKECFGQNGIGNGLESISFCRTCLETAHNHHCRTKHNYRALTVPVEFSELQEHCIIPRLYMELFAVVCIETSHYVAFVKCGTGSDAPWCFFDSMADRKGEQNGYNIPEMVPCPDLPYWLSEDGAKMLNEMQDDRQLPDHAKRLFADAYMCMYQSPDMMMYRKFAVEVEKNLGDG